MKKNSKNLLKEVNEYFLSQPSVDEKAWGIIHDFYHLILTYMDDNGLTRADLARRLGKSRSAISQMFNKTPNLTIKKMIEISDAIGLEINLTSKQVELYHEPKIEYLFIPIPSQKNIAIEETSRISNLKYPDERGNMYDFDFTMESKLNTFEEFSQ